MHTNVCWCLCLWCVSSSFSSSFLSFKLFYTVARVQMSKIYYCRILTLWLLLLMMMMVSTEKDYRTIATREKWKNDRDGLKKKKRRAHTVQRKQEERRATKKKQHSRYVRHTHQSCSKLLLGINNQKFVQRDTVRILFANHYKHIASIHLFIHSFHSNSFINCVFVGSVYEFWTQV